jgi:hypothetical protein
MGRRDSATVVAKLDEMMAQAAELEQLAREIGDEAMLEEVAVLRQDAFIALRDEVRS